MPSDQARAARRRESWSGGVASSFEKLEELDLKEARELSPRERLGLLAEFARYEVRYALLGGYAVGIYAKPRATGECRCEERALRILQLFEG